MLANTIDEAVKKLDEAFGQFNLEAVLAFYEDDAVLVVEPGRLARGREQLKTFFQRAFGSRVSGQHPPQQNVVTGIARVLMQSVGVSSP
jgi:ketosteroid isomerase-like protein